MHISIPQISRVPRAFVISLVFLFALSASLLPATAGITGGKAASAKSDKWQETNSPTAVPDEPHSLAAVFVVNDAGDAADFSLGNGLCDSSVAAGDQCTLRAAIQEANALAGSDTISFSITGTINLTSALPNLSSNITINGPGSALLTVRRNTGGEYRIFTTQSTVVISGLTVTNGKSADGVSGHGQDGGGINNSGTLSLTDVTVTANATGAGSPASFGASGGEGGGIYNSGTLTMTNCSVSGNSCGPGGDGVSFAGAGGLGGGVYSGGTLTMTNCTVSGNVGGRGGNGNNRAGDGGDGGGIYNTGGPLTINGGSVTGNTGGRAGDTQAIGTSGGRGGGIYTESTAITLSNLNLSNNNGGPGGVGSTNNAGGGGGGGALYILSGVATITSSTLSNNHAGNSTTGGSQGYGGAVENGGSLTIVRSTLSGNDGSVGGGILNRVALNMINSTVSGNAQNGLANDSSATMALTNCTLTGNSQAGIMSFGGTVTIRNTIVAGNGSANGGFDAFANFNSQGHNIFGNADGSNGLPATGDQVGTQAVPIQALLGPLADNGGPTLTHALLDGSPALDAADDCVAQPTHCGDSNIPQLTTDQRGAGFSRIVDGPDANAIATVDIGAYERQPTFPNLPDASGNEDTSIVVGFDVSDPGSIISILASSSNTTLVPNAPPNIGVGGTGSSRFLIMNPAANQVGSSDITVTVNRTGGSENKTLTLTVNPVNDAPSFTKGADQTVNENAGAQTVSNWATGIAAGPAADEAGQALTFQVTNNTNAALFASLPAISSSGTLSYTPAAGVSGTATITIALMDNGGTANGGVDTSATQSFVISVLDGGALQFTQSSYFVSEGSGNINITVNRTGGSAGEARVDYATNDSAAIAGQDYTAASGTLIFPSGVTSKTFTVSILNDALDENSEALGLKLSNVAGSGSLGTPNDVTLSISDDDPTPGLRINDVTLIEGSSGTSNAVFTVALSAVSSFTITANYATADSSASSPSDYQAVSGQVTFNPGDLSKTISVTVNGDTTPEVNELFFVNLSNPSFATLNDSQGFGYIQSDDAPGGIIAFAALNSSVNENAGFTNIVVNRTGDTSAAVNVDYATSDGTASLVPCSTASGLASARCDFTSALGTLRFAAGEATKSIVVLINQDNFVEGPESLSLSLSNPTGSAVFDLPGTSISTTLTISDDVTEPAPNPIADPDNFVRQHYHDFLNREADQAGLAFWTNQIAACGTDAACIELKRINVSGAFYLSIEFQETGYLVERMYKISYGNALGTSTLGGFHQFPVPIVRLNEFLPDTQELGQGVVVGVTGWEQVLENNKRTFFDRFVQRSRFLTAFPTTMTASQFVDKLDLNAGGVLLPAERIQLVNDLSTGAKTRAQVVRTIAEDSDLVTAEKNRAFVLMQYFGYLRRNPNDNPDSNHTGYEFWLNKLNQFAGNFVNAEMVKAFIVSGEYRQRFGQ